MTKNIRKMKNRYKSLKYALNGIKYCYREPNMLIHGMAASMVILSGIVLRISPIEWCILILTIGMVKTAEAINTSLEKLVDAILPEHNEKAGMVKDIAAGAVLFSAFMAIAIASIILLPKFIKLFNI